MGNRCFLSPGHSSRRRYLWLAPHARWTHAVLDRRCHRTRRGCRSADHPGETAFYRPVIQVGGDIYGWLRMRDGRMLFWIADATGHGAAAALLTTLAKLLFYHANAENEGPAEIMRAVDRDFRSIVAARSFVTAMCVALDA